MKRRRKPRWIAVSSSLGPDPKVGEDSPEYGKRLVLVTTLIDERGRLWEIVGRGAPVMIGTPPVENDDGA